MARGFDSKSVSDQQEEAQRRREGAREPAPPIASLRRRQLELARLDLVHRLETASSRYRVMLEGTLAALDEQLKRLAAEEAGQA